MQVDDSYEETLRKKIFNSYSPEKRKILEEYQERDDTLDINMLIFHDFDIKKVKWKEIFYWYEDFCNKLNITPTRASVLGIDGRPYNYYRDKKTITYKGVKRKLEKYNFNNAIYELYITCMYHEKSSTSDFMSLLAVHSDENLQFDYGYKNTYVELFFEESLYPVNVEKYQELAVMLHEFTGAGYGYYHQVKLGMHPQLYSRGSSQCAPEDDGDEQKKLKRWFEDYISRNSPEVTHKVHKVGNKFVPELTYTENKNYKYKLGDLRQVYKLNFLSKEHLVREVSNGLTLEQWIKLSKDHGELKELKPGFWSWAVPEERIAKVTEALAPSGIILCL